MYLSRFLIVPNFIDQLDKRIASDPASDLRDIRIFFTPRQVVQLHATWLYLSWQLSVHAAEINVYFQNFIALQNTFHYCRDFIFT